MAVLTVAIRQGVQQHEWGSVTVLAGLAISTLAAPTVDAAASRASEYAADQFAAQAGYSDELGRALSGLHLRTAFAPDCLADTR
jgi:Zn-dependent protease with chaperone function